MNQQSERPIIDLVAGTRPNFVKIGPLFHHLKETSWCLPRLIHTGQHYSSELSEDIWMDLNLPPPFIVLEGGRGSHAEQTGTLMIAYEKSCLASAPSLVVVPGDVNSSLACALAARKLGIPIAHLEAGLRSHDASMPEEINRRLIDHMADILWTPSEDADKNLQTEGISLSKVHRVGNIMIDALKSLKSRIDGSPPPVTFPRYGVLTLHRPSNVDFRERLRDIVTVIEEISQKIPILFPVHPRARQRLEEFGLWDQIVGCPNIQATKSLSYIRFLGAVARSSFVLTDSGGLQEETSYLGIPCFTLRENTERPITITLGTNELVRLESASRRVRERIDEVTVPRTIPLWDGHTSERIGNHLNTYLASH